MEPDLSQPGMLTSVLSQFDEINSAYFFTSNEEEDVCAHGDSDPSNEEENTGELLSLISDRLLTSIAVDERAWHIRSHEDVGRHLVAATDLTAGATVFREQPLAVGEAEAYSERAMNSDMASLAVELLRIPDGRGLEAARMLQEAINLPPRSAKQLQIWALSFQLALAARNLTRTDGSALLVDRSSALWALSVCSANGHHADDHPERAVLGVLASLMQHSCEPSCEVSIADMAQGSVLTLRTTRDVRAGESLSITYLDADAPVAERRGQLSSQHGFLCQCAKCCREAG